MPDTNTKMDLDAARKALSWLVNLYHGVGRAGGEPESGEWEAAIENAVAEATADATSPSPVPPPEVTDRDVEGSLSVWFQDEMGARHTTPLVRESMRRVLVDDRARCALLASRRAASPVGDAVDVVLDAALRDFQRGSEIERLKAELAKAQSTKSETVEKYERWLAEAAEHDVATLSDWSNDALAETLEYTRNYAPSGCHAALNVAASRLRASPSPASAPDFEAEVREAIATLDASGFPGGFTPEGNPTFEAAVARIVAASRPASALGGCKWCNAGNDAGKYRMHTIQVPCDAPRADTGGKGSRCVHSDGNACEQYRLQGQRCQDCPESGGAK